MSYRGRPSKGCEGCRARKVKCDETKPTCNRCVRSGQECRYRDRTDVLFRNQTELAAQRAEESWRRRSKSFQGASSESSTNQRPTTGDHLKLSQEHEQARPNDSGPVIFAKTAHNSNDITLENVRVVSPRAASGKLPVFATPRPDLRQMAYARFIYDFVVLQDPDKPFEQPSDALFSFVPLLYEHTHPSSCLATVVNAVAYINFAHRCNAPQVISLAEESFSEGIMMLSRTIASEETAASDEALCSVHLMGIFETLTNFQRQGSFATHQHGANAILQLRTIEDYYSSPVSARLYEVAYAQMLLASLQTAKIPPIPVQDAPAVRRYLPTLSNGSGTFVVRLIWKATQLHAMWHETKRSAPPPTNRLELQEILQLALNLDAEYREWESGLPSAWKYNVEPNTPEARSKYSNKWQRLILTSKGAPTAIHTYSTLKRCSIWSYYRTSRMFLLRDLLEILNWMARLPEAEMKTSLTRTWKNLAYSSVDAEQDADETTITAFSDDTLRVCRSLVTRHLIDIIEVTCSSVLGTFAVPVYGKSPEDVMGMRGHIIIWPLSTMDAILSSGLVLDSNSSIRPDPASRSSSTGSLPRQSAPLTGESSMNPFYHDTSMATAAHGFDYLPPMQPLPSNISAQRQASASPVLGATGTKQHPFDSMPRHSNDSPLDDMSTPEVDTIDIAAKREWLNSMLYYIGAELGIRKALAVPVIEGYMPIVKPRVDGILGQR